MKRLISVFLCVLLVGTLMSVALFADDAVNGDGLSLSEALEAIQTDSTPRNAPPTSDTVVIAVAALSIAAIASIIITKKR